MRTCIFSLILYSFLLVQGTTPVCLYSDGIAIEICDSADVKFAEISVSVSDGSIPNNSSASIYSEILLNSEVKGYIENPNYYFESVNARTDSDLDLLMMTQGWRRYEINDIMSDTVEALKFPLEQSQSISGIIGTSSKRRLKGTRITLFAPSTFEINRFQLNDSNRFTINGLDFVDGTTFVLEAQNKDGTASNLRLNFEEPERPVISTLLNTPMYAVADSVELISSDFVWKQPRTRSLLDLQELGPVTVVARKKQSWKNRGGIEPHRGYNEGDEKIGHFPNMESLLRSLTVKIKYSEEGSGLPEPRFGEYVMNDFMPTAVFIDGFLSEQREVFDLNPQNVNSIQYFRPGDARVATYTPEALHTGVLLVTTKYGNEGAKERKPSMVSVTPLGYRPPVEFYTSRFQPPHENPNKFYPYQATLYWNPRFKISPDSSNRIELYGLDSYQVLHLTLQGMTSDGKIIDITKTIQVHEN